MSDVEVCALDGERLVEQAQDPLVGQTLEDRYVIVEALGAGAMGTVYRATHTVLDRDYAIKVLFGEMSANKTLRERFRREAQATSRIEHPNVVAVHDFGSTDEGLLYIAMSFLSGGTLEMAILNEAPFEASRAAELTKQIASGLAAAHELRIVHRDLKPANVILLANARQETAKIVDFGLARITDAAHTDGRLTQAGFTLGSPAYMAPEQIADPDVGPSADLYALGVVLYEMLAGEPPFMGTPAQVVLAHGTQAVPPLPPSDGLETIAATLLEKRPQDRYASADEVVRAIDGWLRRRTDPEAPVPVAHPSAGAGSAPFSEPIGAAAATLPTARSPDSRAPRLEPRRAALQIAAVLSGLGLVWFVATSSAPAPEQRPAGEWAAPQTSPHPKASAGDDPAESKGSARPTPPPSRPRGGGDEGRAQPTPSPSSVVGAANNDDLAGRASATPKRAAAGRGTAQGATTDQRTANGGAASPRLDTTTRGGVVAPQPSLAAAPGVASPRGSSTAKATPELRTIAAAAAAAAAPQAAVATAPAQDPEAPGWANIVTTFGGDPRRGVVVVDGRARGEAPMRLALPPGEHVVEVRPSWRSPVRTVVVIPSGGTVRVTLDMAP